MIRTIIDTVIKSMSRTIGRILGYIILALIVFFIYNSFFKAATIETIDTPLKNDYIDYFSRTIDNIKYFNINYLAFTHKCEESTCYTLLTGDIQKGTTTEEIELIEVESLPVANEETLNKVYKVDNKYYITEKINNDYTPIPLNEDLKGKIIYFDYKSLTYEILDDIYNNNSIIQNSSYINKTETSNSNANTKKQYQLWRNSQGNIKLNHYTFYFPYLTFVSPRVEITYVENGEVITPVTSFSSNFSYSISEWYAPELEKYFSLTPFETSYTWNETELKTSNDGYKCNSCDYITFKESNTTLYSNGTYENLEIKGNVFYSNLKGITLERGNSYEKISTFILCLFLSLFFTFSICRTKW